MFDTISHFSLFSKNWDISLFILLLINPIRESYIGVLNNIFALGFGTFPFPKLISFYPLQFVDGGRG